MYTEIESGYGNRKPDAQPADGFSRRDGNPLAFVRDMFRTFQIPLSWSELVKRTMRDVNSDNCLGLAAQLSYYCLLALVPAILCVVALASFFPGHLVQDVIGKMGAIVPSDIVGILREQIENVSNGQNSGIFTFGLLMAVLSSSAAMVSITDALNKAYDIEEARPWWKVRITAILLTLGTAVFIVFAFALVMIGPTLADQLASRLGLGAAFALGWKILQWPVVFAMIVVAVGTIFYFGPDAEQDWEWVTPGAVLGTILWLIASLGFKIYVTNYANYNESYGSLGGVIVLMLWFYLSSLAVLVGAEMNAEIEHASPHGKAAGEKVPGEKKKLGAAAARAFAQRPRTDSRRPVAFPKPVSDSPPPPRKWAAAAAYGIMAADVVRALRSGEFARSHSHSAAPAKR